MIGESEGTDFTTKTTEHGLVKKSDTPTKHDSLGLIINNLLPNFHTKDCSHGHHMTVIAHVIDKVQRP